MPRTPPACARRRSLCVTARAVSVTAAAAVAACTFVGPTAVAATTQAAPASVRADDPAVGLIEVTPRRVEPGTEIRVRVEFCVTEQTAMATSVAFEADVDLQRTADGIAFHGSAVISVDAEPGTYGITVVCGVDARESRGSFKVVPASAGARHDGRRHEGGHQGRDRHHEPPPHHASPIAPVRAGGGGTAGDRTADGAKTAQRVGLTMAGGAMVAGAVVWAVRRRRPAPTRAGEPGDGRR